MPVHAQIKREDFPDVPVMSPSGMNMQTGSYVNTHTEFTIGSLPFVRSWHGINAPTINNSEYQDPARFGTWTHNYAWGAMLVNGYPTVGLWGDVYTDGGKARHQLITGTTWGPWDLDAMGTLLTQNSGTGNFTFRNRNGDLYTISNYVVTQADYADGRQLSLSYDSSRHLRTVLSSTGDAIVLDYTSGRLTAACGYNRTLHYVTTSTTCTSDTPEVKVTYTYASNAYTSVLASATYQDGRVVNMSYTNAAGTEPALTCVTFPSSSTCEVTNSGNTQTLPTGETRSYGFNVIPYQDPNDPPYPPGYIPEGSSSYTDTDGFMVAYEFTGGFVQKVTDRTGVTQYEWSGAALHSVTFPLGNKVIIERDLRQNPLSLTRRAVSGSGLADTVVTQSFPATNVNWTGCTSAAPKVCNKPAYTIDARGNQTDYTYDTSHGGILTVTSPAVGGIRPVKRFIYVQRYAWLKNSSGGYTQAATPIWLLSETRTCRTTATVGTACAGGSSDEVVTAYDYGPNSGPNALLVRGIAITADGQTLRTCFGYDAFGRKISETAPRANLTSCP